MGSYGLLWIIWVVMVWMEGWKSGRVRLLAFFPVFLVWYAAREGVSLLISVTFQAGNG